MMGQKPVLAEAVTVEVVGEVKSQPSQVFLLRQPVEAVSKVVAAEEKNALRTIASTRAACMVTPSILLRSEGPVIH